MSWPFALPSKLDPESVVAKRLLPLQSRSDMQILAQCGATSPSSGPLQFRAVSARHYLLAVAGIDDVNRRQRGAASFADSSSSHT